MKKFKKRINIILLTLLITSLFPISHVRGTIASVILTPANPTTLSNALSYYLAGNTYNFTVQVIDPDITGWAQLTNVQITIPNTTNIILSIDPSGVGAGLPVVITSGTVDATADVAGTYNNCTVTFNVTFKWDTPESVYTAGRTVSTVATTSFPAPNNFTVNSLVSYGVCSSMTILNFAQSGVASDGMVNQYHDTFTVTGTPVYNVPGADATDAIETRDPGEINLPANLILYRNGVSTGIVSTGVLPALSFIVPTGTVSTLGANTLRARALMATAGGPETSNNNLALTCDEVEITGMTFVNGGGINAPAFYRSMNVPGTEIQLTARMRNSLSPMVGNTTIRISNYTDAQNIDVVIPNGSTTGTAVVLNPAGAGLPANPGTLQNFYRAQMIIGGSYGGDLVEGQNVNTRINQPAPLSIYWDRNYHPWAASTPFTGWIGISATAYSFTFNWTPLASVAPNEDFYSYRIYYRESPPVTAFQLIDRNTAGYALLADCTQGTATILGLTPLTNYEFYITAIDVFGQEVPPAQSLPGTPLVGINTIGTLASTISVEVTDGITTHLDNSFTTPPAVDNPADRPMRQTAINFKVFIVAAGDLPDIVNIIVANNTTMPPPGPPDFIDAFGDINPLLVENIDYYRITTLKTGTNTWSGYVPDTNPLITVGTNIKFIVETVKDGIKSYADANSEAEIPATANPNDYPYTFNINMQPKFTPWPTRVLNNVITDKNPKAYPAYYLTDDAYVSIVVFDIKGRPVKTLLDNSFRRGGENIKEGGWSGDNKSRKKVGIGLYYMHFKAKRVSDGKVILDSFQKVVMSY